MLNKTMDWKEISENNKDKSFALSVVAVLFLFIFFPKLDMNSMNVSIEEKVLTLDDNFEIEEKELEKPTDTALTELNLNIIIAPEDEQDEFVLPIIDTIEPTTINPFNVKEIIDSSPTGKVFDIWDVDPILTKRAPISYPNHLRKFGISGTVLIEAVVNSNGSVGNVSIVSGLHPDIDKEILKAVKNYHYKAAENNGKPISVRVKFPIHIKVK